MGKCFHIDSRQTVGKAGNQHKSFPSQRKAAAKTGGTEINHHHTGKTQQTSDPFAQSHLLAPNHKMSQQDGEKGVGCRDNGPLHSCGIGQADIKKQILHGGLYQTQQYDPAANLSFRKRRTMRRDRTDDPGQHARQRKTIPGKKNLTSRISSRDGKQLISHLHAGKSAAPQKGTQQCQRTYHRRMRQPIFLRFHKSPYTPNRVLARQVPCSYVILLPAVYSVRSHPRFPPGPVSSVPKRAVSSHPLPLPASGGSPSDVWESGCASACPLSWQ